MGHGSILPGFGESLGRVFEKDLTRDAVDASLQILNAAHSGSRALYQADGPGHGNCATLQSPSVLNGMAIHLYLPGFMLRTVVLPRVLAPACDGDPLSNGLPQSDGAASPVWLRPLNADVSPSRSQFGTFVCRIGMCDRE